MARKDISDLQVVKAYEASKESYRKKDYKYPYEFLMEWTGEPEKVCIAAMERAEKNDLIIVGVSLRTGWLSDKGKELLNNGKS